jgi:uncharacterized Zn finger protein (UPF0148 family)
MDANRKIYECPQCQFKWPAVKLQGHTGCPWCEAPISQQGTAPTHTEQPRHHQSIPRD